MRAVHVVALLGVAFGVVAVVCWRGEKANESTPSARTRPLSPAEAASEQAAARPIGDRDSLRDSAAPSPAAAAAESARPGSGSGVAIELSPAGRGLSWPKAPASGSASGNVATATGDPEVPARIAFRALWYLGVDPEAEKTWARAINDPAHPPGVRSDLIVDMIDEGYTDNNRPTKADLPVIAARLEILERYAPYAMDEVNRKAFEEAYRTLLELYIRLGGKPRHR